MLSRKWRFILLALLILTVVLLGINAVRGRQSRNLNPACLLGSFCGESTSASDPNEDFSLVTPDKQPGASLAETAAEAEIKLATDAAPTAKEARIPSKNYEEWPEISSEAAIVLERVSGRVLYAKDADGRRAPASLTKMMSCLIALEHFGDTDPLLPVDVQIYLDMVEANSSMAGYYGNEQTSFRDLLYGSMLPSGGEATGSLAIHTAGSIAAFVELMNEKALALGLLNSHFTNVTGLDADENYSSAADLGRLLRHALDNPSFRELICSGEYLSSKTADHPDGILIRSTVLSRLTEEDMVGFRILGGKSGTTFNAGQCWATLAEIDGNEYLAVVMGAPLGSLDEPNNYQISDSLRLYAFLKTLLND